LKQFWVKLDEEKKFLAEHGLATESDRLKAYKLVIQSPKALNSNMGDFESNSWIEKSKQKFLLQAKGRVLDVGTGVGRSLSDLLKNKRIMEIASIDILPEAIEKGKESAKNSEIPVKFIQGDFHDMREMFKDKCFDTVVSCFSLCSSERPVELLKEMDRLAIEKILLVEHGLSKFKFLRWIGQKMEIFPNYQSPWEVGCHQDKDIEDILEQAGLKIISKQAKLLGHVYFITIRPSDIKTS
jgi:SAM-dependent methyltransferase